MDDLTMDCLDTILIQWLNKAKSPNDFIDFSYEKFKKCVAFQNLMVLYTME
jgi:hypothetical protein